MEKIMKTMTKLLMLASLTLLSSVEVRAASNEDFSLAAIQKSYWQEKSSGAYQPAIRLWYVGTATEAVVTITSKTFLAQAPFGTAETAIFGTLAGTYDLSAASYDTIGELCDAVDGLANYECLMLGAKRNDDTILLRDQTAASETNDLKGNRGYDVHFDTGPINGGGNGIRVNDLRVGRKPGEGKRVTLRQCTGSASSSGATGGSLQVFGKLKIYEENRNSKGGWTWDDTFQVYRDTFTNVTSKTWTFAPSGIGGIEFAKDAHVVVSMGNNSNLQAQDGTDYLDCWFEEK